VMALEEFPANREFWGRNFNAGEVIQLVLRGLDGRWLPERHVQMVMVHELAHCVQMNHSKAFWGVRNGYAEELKELWAKGYTGEGMWGGGRGLGTGEFMGQDMTGQEMVPEHLCGGVYKRRAKRRRGGKNIKDEEDPEVRKIMRAEQKEKRILKKFGPGGSALGADEEERVKLEQLYSKAKGKGKPRVAGSARARELRAAAALARFDKVKVEESNERSETEGEEERSTTEGEDEDDWLEADIKEEQDERQKIDAAGDRLVRVCGEEDGDEGGGEDEKRELLMTDFFEVDRKTFKREGESSKIPSATDLKTTASTAPKSGESTSKSTVPKTSDSIPTKNGSSSSKQTPTATKPESNVPLRPKDSVAQPDPVQCKACSCENDNDAVLCVVCSNVLKPEIMRSHWRCQSAACKGGEYINAGDYGLCQVCNAKKP
jgi:hypothetical protein